jgi:hypothetical protein
MPQEENLQVKGPRAHIGIKISQVRDICYRLKGSLVTQAGADTFGEGGLSGANVACNDEKPFGHIYRSDIQMG